MPMGWRKLESPDTRLRAAGSMPPAMAIVVMTIGRAQRRGHSPVEPENPYWAGRSFTYSDPDGWRVVICRETGI
ncbi:VOC family protein [Pararhizobium sp. PWRC1-1]|uniref:VOC family protein n=1 Tax=Pararhizobium sp. PWRC1-1 TaxID=2804566 RepID=UPI003CF63E58